MRDIIKEHKKEMFVVFILIPILIYGLSVIPLFPAGANNDWAGFWGGDI